MCVRRQSNMELGLYFTFTHNQTFSAIATGNNTAFPPLV
jgi:hypothetical protein